jgi:predicted  nucleic acid-binding Zn-ribbon protein
VSGSLRRSATARIGRGGFGWPPAGAGGSVRRTPQWRSLGRLYPHLAAELHPGRNGRLDGGELAAGSKRKLWWLCGRCGHAWQATVDNRVTGKSGCPMCAIERRASSRGRVKRARSLAVKRLISPGELHPGRNGDLDGETLAVFSTRKVWWLCARCGHVWLARVADRSAGTGCPGCAHKSAGQTAHRARRDSAITDPGRHEQGRDEVRIVTGAESRHSSWPTTSLVSFPFDQDWPPAVERTTVFGRLRASRIGAPAARSRPPAATASVAKRSSAMIAAYTSAVGDAIICSAAIGR